jgi:hypothetical protein
MQLLHISTNAKPLFEMRTGCVDIMSCTIGKGKISETFNRMLPRFGLHKLRQSYWRWLIWWWSTRVSIVYYNHSPIGDLTVCVLLSLWLGSTSTLVSTVFVILSTPRIHSSLVLRVPPPSKDWVSFVGLFLLKERSSIWPFERARWLLKRLEAGPLSP